MPSNINIVNRKAGHEFHLLDCYQAGIELVGTEIKALRQGKANLQDSFSYFHRGELYVKNLHISEYSQATFFNHEPKRTRRLLLKKRELKKLRREVEGSGKTIVPRKLFINNKGLAKLEVCLAKGKKLHDKRQALKEKEQKREMNKKLKDYG